jgi:hypothetical protein
MIRRSWMIGASIEATLELWGVVAARREGSNAAFVHARAGGGVSGIV